MTLKKYFACALAIGFVLQAGCARVGSVASTENYPRLTAIGITGQQPIAIVGGSVADPNLRLTPENQWMLDLFSIEYSSEQCILETQQNVSEYYLRNANLVPTDLSGTREEQLAWYGANAVRVDINAVSVFGSRDGITQFQNKIRDNLKGPRMLPDQEPARIPDTGPTPDP